MPITTSVPVELFDQERYHEVDRVVTGIAFEVHNDFGRFFDERIYQDELTRKCRNAGLVVVPELEVTVRLGDFRKSYFVDHLVEGGVIVETKTVAALGSAHVGQVLNYLFLTGLHHATLLNFRTGRVEHEFVSTTFDPADRQRFEIVTKNWRPVGAKCERLLTTLADCLTEWGALLDPALYRDAMTHFLGGESEVVREIPIRSQGSVVGTQKMRLVDDGVAFSLTSLLRDQSSIEHHLRLLAHTDLRAIHWVNMNRGRIELKTITKN